MLTVSSSTARRFIRVGWPLVAIATIGLVIPIFWYHDHQLVYFWDQTFPLRPGEALRSLLSLWHPEYGFGRIDPTAVAFVPYFFLIWLCATISGSIVNGQILLYYGLFVAAGSGMYMLLRHLLHRNDTTTVTDGHTVQWASFLGALFYLFNPFTLLYIWRIVNASIFLYSFLPLLILLTIRYISGSGARYLAGIAITLLLITPGLSNPAFIPIVAFVVLFAWLACGIMQRKNIWRIGIVCCVAAGMAAFWLIPVLRESSTVGTVGSFGGVQNALVSNSTDLDPANSLRLLGGSPITETFKGEHNYSWINFYNPQQNPLGNLIPFLPLFAALAVLMGKPNRPVKRLLLSALFLELIFLLLAKGVAAPFGDVFQFMFAHIQPFQMYRDPFSKFGFGLAFTSVILLAVAAAALLGKLRPGRYAHVIAASCAAVLILGYAWPMVNGKVFRDPGTVRPGAHVAIPSDYYQASAIMNKTADKSRVLSYPQQQLPLMSEKWQNGYVGFDPLRALSDHPLISTTSSYVDEQSVTDNIYRYLESSADPAKTFNALGIQWVVIRKQDNHKFSGAAGNIQHMQAKLASLPSFKKVYDSHYLALYKIAGYDPKPQVIQAAQTLPGTQTQNAIPIANRFFDGKDFADAKKDRVLNLLTPAISFRADGGDKKTSFTYKDRVLDIKKPASKSDNGSVTNVKNFDIGGRRYVGVTVKTNSGSGIIVGFSRYDNTTFKQGAYAYVMNPPSGASGIDYHASKTYQLVFDLSQFTFTPNHININVTNLNEKEATATITGLSAFDLTDATLSSIGSETLDITLDSAKKVYDLPIPDRGRTPAYKYIAMDIKTSPGSSFVIANSRKDNFKYISGEVLNPEYNTDLSVTENGTFVAKKWTTVYMALDPQKFRNFIHINGYRSEDAKVSGIEVKNVRLTDYAASSLDIMERLEQLSPATAFITSKDATTPQLSPPGARLTTVVSNPSTQKLQLRGASGTIAINTGEHYSDGWQLTASGAAADNAKFLQHVNLNGLQNGWIINIDALCKQSNACDRRPDGRYDLQLALTFTPQKQFSHGAAISLATLCGCVVYAGAVTIKKRAYAAHTGRR